LCGVGLVGTYRDRWESLSTDGDCVRSQ